MRNIWPSPPSAANEMVQFEVYRAPSGPTISPLGRLAKPFSSSVRAPVAKIERDQVRVVGGPLLVGREDLDAVEPVAAPRQPDQRIG